MPTVPIVRSATFPSPPPETLPAGHRAAEMVASGLLVGRVDQMSDTTASAQRPPSAAQLRMYDAMLASRHKKSLYPLSAFALASGGKLVLAIGAGLTVNGAYGHERSRRNTGIALIVVGFAGALSAALMFSRDVKIINYKLGWILKCCSISAAAMIGSGYGLRGYGIAEKNLAIARCAVVLLTSGLSTMSVVLPWFVAHSEAYRGQMLLQPREKLRVGCMGVGAGILFGWAVSASGASYPVAASQTVLTVGAMLLTLGIALSTSDIVHQAARDAVVGTQKEHATSAKDAVGGEIELRKSIDISAAPR